MGVGGGVGSLFVEGLINYAIIYRHNIRSILHGNIRGKDLFVVPITRVQHTNLRRRITVTIHML